MKKIIVALAVIASCEKTAEILAKKGYSPVLVPYQTNWHTFHSGIHCSTCRIWSE